MDDNSAIRWSEYELVKRQTESSFRVKLSQELGKYIAEYKENSFPAMYIEGMERARLLITYDKNYKNNEIKNINQDKLF